MALSNYDELASTGHSDPYVVTFTVSGDATYPAGGTPAFAAFMQIKSSGRTPISCTGGTLDGSYTAMYDVDNDKLLVFDPSSAAEVSPADLSGSTFQLTAWCK